MQQLIFITAPWCATCRQVKPIALQIAKAFDTEMKILDMIQDEAECATYYPTSLPFIVYGNHSIAGGACTKAAIMSLFDGVKI